MSNSREVTSKQVTPVLQNGFTAVNPEGSTLTQPHALGAVEYEHYRNTVDNSLPPINGSGRVVLFRCNNTGKLRAVKAIVWNSGRITHRNCCGTTLDPGANPDPGAPTQTPFHEGVKASLIHVGHGGVHTALSTTSNPVTALTLLQRHRLPDKGLKLVIKRGPVTQEYALESGTIQFLQWLQDLHHTPIGANPPPSLDFGGEAARRAAEQTVEALTLHREQLAEALGAVDTLAKTPIKAKNAATPAPIFAPLAAWRDGVNVDWSTVRGPKNLNAPAEPESFTELERAALSMMVFQTYATFTPEEREAPNCDDLQKLLGLESPDPVSGALRQLAPRRYFEFLPPDWDAPESALTLEPASGKALEELGAWRLRERPPEKVALPDNWRERPKNWTWLDEDGNPTWDHVEIKWHERFFSFPGA